MTSAEQGQLQISSSPSFTSIFIGGGIFENKRINLSPQPDATSLEPVQTLVFTQVARSCKAPEDGSQDFCSCTHPNPHPAHSGGSGYSPTVPEGQIQGCWMPKGQQRIGGRAGPQSLNFFCPELITCPTFFHCSGLQCEGLHGLTRNYAAFQLT